MLFGVGYCMSLDFATMIGRNYGSGCQGTVSPDGQSVTHSYSGYIPGYSFHQVGAIQQFLTEAVVDTFFAPGAAPNQTGALPRMVFIRFSHSSNTHVVFSGEDALDGNGYVHDLTSNVTQVVGDCEPSDYWVGTLPSPDAAFISLNPSLLVFSSPDGSSPASQAVTASNTGSGSLGTLTATVNPASATWLAAAAGGTTITNTVTPGSLARGTYCATVAVSSASALNIAVYTVVLNVRTAVNAPTNVRLGKIWHDAGQPQSCVGVAWRDNSTNEVGFVVERAPEGGEFVRIATVAANATSYADTVPGVGVWTYRVLAITAADSSGWSNEPSIRLSFPLKITVTAPAAGAQWVAGTTQYIRWFTDGVPNVQIKYSLDGEDWLLITGSGSIGQDSATWGNYPWVVPALNQDSVQIRVEAYGDPSMYGAGSVNVHPSTGVSASGAAKRALPSAPSIMLRVGRSGPARAGSGGDGTPAYDVRGARIPASRHHTASGIAITAGHE